MLTSAKCKLPWISCLDIGRAARVMFLNTKAWNKKVSAYRLSLNSY